jgi:hypothetical protein
MNAPEAKSDRELLELAAKAAGMNIDFGDALLFGDDLCYFDWETGGFWNALAKDGDAFRLAVKLGMFVDVFPESYIHAQAGGSTERCDELWGTDPYAATRRAIVRAAATLAARASIGREEA